MDYSLCLTQTAMLVNAEAPAIQNDLVIRLANAE
jgi:hypothetical protein